jgi:Domain of unknown function (DUF1998)
MSKRAHGQVRRGQILTAYGPGALIDLPRHSAIVGGLDTWPATKYLEEIGEPRLAAKLRSLTGVLAPRLFAPPAASNNPGEPIRGITAWRFPEWFLVQEIASSETRERSRRLVHRRALDNKDRFEKLRVVATRFVRACPRGHVDDLNWHHFVHGPEDSCRRQLWLDERGTSGDLADLVVRCECNKSRGLYEATLLETNPLGICRGQRPWLGRNTSEECHQPSRLLIRTASNAYFSQGVSVLSIPEKGNEIEAAVRELWNELQIVQSVTELAIFKRLPGVMARLAPFSDDDVFDAIQAVKHGPAVDKPVKFVELDALLAAPQGFGEDVPINADFHARRLPDRAWSRSERSKLVDVVIQLHRLREVVALVGFTRFEAVTPDINGDYESDVERADIAIEPTWFPAVENRGEGVFVGLRADAVDAWLARESVRSRLGQLEAGHHRWLEDRKSQRPFPGAPYVLLHTLSHLLIQSLAMRCGYPASSIRERIYADVQGGRYGLLLYTGSSDADGTLGGLVQQARHIEDHLAQALRAGELCSNDPICAQHQPGEDLEERWLHGAACHGCALVAEPSCEMRNDYLDRGLVVPIVGQPNAAFFEYE